jgi:hypothetical protein
VTVTVASMSVLTKMLNAGHYDEKHIHGHFYVNAFGRDDHGHA